MGNEVGFRRLIRMKRVANHAADLLEKSAASILECNTIDGDWGEDIAGKEEYEDMVRTAEQLRLLS